MYRAEHLHGVIAKIKTWKGLFWSSLDYNKNVSAVDKPNIISKPTTVSEHFLTANHSASDMLLIPIQKLYSAQDSIRKAREAFLITKANTLEPNGLNKRDETY